MQWHDAVSTLVELGKPYVIITVIGKRGSVPRDGGTKMVVCDDQNYCTIGGGHLEYRAIDLAKEMLSDGQENQRIEQFALGPTLGQCCGGNVTLLFELFEGLNLNIMLFGAGHVGKALVSVLHQLPCKLRWIDSRADEFPEVIPSTVKKMISEEPIEAVLEAPANTYFIVMTHKHSLDFDIIEKILTRDDAKYVGLIGSTTKWEKFKLRFAHKDYKPSFYNKVRCPVGLNTVTGKRPIEVAISIAAEIIADYQSGQCQKKKQRGVDWKVLKRQLREEAIAQKNAHASTIGKL